MATQNNIDSSNVDFEVVSGELCLKDPYITTFTADSGIPTKTLNIYDYDIPIAAFYGITAIGSGNTLTISGYPVDRDFLWISTQTASASATVSFTGLNSQYFVYVVMIKDLIPATDNTVLRMRTSTNGGASYDSGAADYGWIYYNAYNDIETTTYDASDSELELIPGVGNNTNERVNGTITLINPLGTAQRYVYWNLCSINASANKYHNEGMGKRLASADVDAIQFSMSAGNIASGSFRLYGIRTTYP